MPYDIQKHSKITLRSIIFFTLQYFLFDSSHICIVIRTFCFPRINVQKFQNIIIETSYLIRQASKQSVLQRENCTHLSLRLGRIHVVQDRSMSQPGRKIPRGLAGPRLVDRVIRATISTDTCPPGIPVRRNAFSRQILQLAKRGAVGRVQAAPDSDRSIAT